MLTLQKGQEAWRMDYEASNLGFLVLQRVSRGDSEVAFKIALFSC